MESKLYHDMKSKSSSERKRKMSLDHQNVVDHAPGIIQGNDGATRDLEVAKRRKTIEDCTKALDHASKCLTDHCQYQRCLTMKNVWKHFNTCQQRMNKLTKCSVCDNVHSLLNYHANICHNDSCSISRCREIKRRFAKSQTTEHMFLNRLIRFRMSSVPTVEKLKTTEHSDVHFSS